VGVDTSKWQVSDYLANAPAVGLSPSNFVPSAYQSICAAVAQNSVPTKAPSTFVTACTGSLIIRGILYFKSNPGDCGTGTKLGLQDAQLTELAGGAASAALKTASTIAGAASGIASIAGAALPGIGVAVSAITQIFANHAAAVANEQTVICQVAGVINQVIPFYDNLVRSGQISPNTAYAGMQNYFNQVIEQLDGIQKSCDAACVYIAILQAHSTFVEKYYPLIAPVSAAPKAPGSPPVTATPNAPGAVQVNGGSTVSGSSVKSSVIIPGDMAVDYYGNEVTLGTAFFSNASSGASILPGVAGDYFTAAQLALPGVNPWGLNVNSVISDGEYAQIVANGIVPLKSAKTAGTSLTEIILIAAVLLVAYMLLSGKKLSV